MSDKTSDKRLLSCPFCGGEAIYEIKRENELGTIIPQLFCNHCKMIFEIENDSPYLNDDKTHDYLKEKLYVWWNTRKPMERIVERLEEELNLADKEKERCVRENPLQFDSAKGYATGIYNAIAFIKSDEIE